MEVASQEHVAVLVGKACQRLWKFDLHHISLKECKVVLLNGILHFLEKVLVDLRVTFNLLIDGCYVGLHLGLFFQVDFSFERLEREPGFVPSLG